MNVTDRTTAIQMQIALTLTADTPAPAKRVLPEMQLLIALISTSAQVRTTVVRVRRVTTPLVAMFVDVQKASLGTELIAQTSTNALRIRRTAAIRTARAQTQQGISIVHVPPKYAHATMVSMVQMVSSVRISMNVQIQTCMDVTRRRYVSIQSVHITAPVKNSIAAMARSARA